MLSRRRYALSTAQNRSDFLARAWAGDTVDARVQEHVARVTLLGLAPVALYIIGVLARHRAPLVVAACTLNAKAQSRVTLSLRQEYF